MKHGNMVTIIIILFGAGFGTSGINVVAGVILYSAFALWLCLSEYEKFDKKIKF